jgi:hypothetical protein
MNRMRRHFAFGSRPSGNAASKSRPHIVRKLPVQPELDKPVVPNCHRETGGEIPADATKPARRTGLHALRVESGFGLPQIDSHASATTPAFIGDLFAGRDYPSAIGMQRS